MNDIYKNYHNYCEKRIFEIAALLDRDPDDVREEARKQVYKKPISFAKYLDRWLTDVRKVTRKESL